MTSPLFYSGFSSTIKVLPLLSDFGEVISLSPYSIHLAGSTLGSMRDSDGNVLWTALDFHAGLHYYQFERSVNGELSLREQIACFVPEGRTLGEMWELFLPRVGIHRSLCLTS